MGYKYSAIHNTILHDGVVDDADDDNPILKDGERIRVGMMMLDHDSVQHAVAADAATRPPSQRATARQELSDAERAKQELNDAYALYQLDVANRWRGGIGALQTNDVVAVGGRDFVVKSYEDDKLVITDANPGRVTLRDASPTLSDAETARRDAYLAYDSEIQNAWRR